MSRPFVKGNPLTEQEFFRRARAGRTWRITTAEDNVAAGPGAVRSADDYLCPIAAVAGVWDAEAGAERTGLPRWLTRRIVTASDKPRSKYRPWLLKQLGVRAPHEETPDVR